MRWQVALVLCAGCDAIFGLHDETVVACEPPAGAIFIGSGDFDKDGVDNTCDPCPLDPDVYPGHGDADADGDGIPDACDPDLRGGGANFPDCILLFDGFSDPNHAATLDPRWIASPDSAWSLGVCPDAQFGLCVSQLAGVAVLSFDLGSAVVEGIEIAGVLSEVGSIPTLIGVSGDLEQVDADSIGHFCELDFDNDGAMTHTKIADQTIVGSGLGQVATSGSADVALDGSAENIIDLQWIPATTQTCTSVTPGLPAQQGMPFTPEATSAGVRVFDVRADLGYVIVFGACSASGAAGQ